MAGYTGTFKRKEVKYRLSAAQAAQIKQALAAHMEPDAYGQTAIASRYYDTAHRDMISRSLEKPLYKEKLRLRSYGQPTAESAVFVELKKKHDGIVYKRRIAASQGAAQMLMDGHPYETALAVYPLADETLKAEARTAASFQTAAEITACVRRNGPLFPSMDILVKRVAWAPLPDERGAAAEGVRITFDEDIRYRDLMGAVDGRQEVPLLEPGEAIMEVKVPGAYPLWLVDALNACRALPTSFSKYGKAYLACTGAQAPQAYRQQAAYDARLVEPAGAAVGLASEPAITSRPARAASPFASRAPQAANPALAEQPAITTRPAGERRTAAEGSHPAQGAHARCVMNLPEIVASA